MKTLKKYLTQWSTWRGALLLAAAASGVHPDAANAFVNVGDAVITGQSAAAVGVGMVGAWEAFRNERKDKGGRW